MNRRVFPALARTAAVTLLAICSWAPPKAQGQTNDQTPDTNKPIVQLSVTSNLVVVRVVVRDARGTPVEGLARDNFKIFDRGQEQSIIQFEAHSPLALPPAFVAGQAPPAALPKNFLALYFDDLYTSVVDLNQARNAAVAYLGAHLQPGDRVAIFASAGMLCDFTSDPKQIHDALLKLRVSPQAVSRVQECPQLSDYQASEIARTPLYDPNVDGWKLARHDAYECSNATNRVPWEALEPIIRAQAMRIVDQARILTRADLDGLDLAVKNISQMQGRRTVVLVSPGFLSEAEQSPLDSVIDLALRSQVVISSLDPQGVAVLMREGDASQHDLPGGDIAGAAFSLDKSRALTAAGVLEDVAHSTGGVYFHNSNDLKAGFGALAGSPAYYILAFAPRNMKQDGQYHSLKVTLAGPGKGYTVQARRGYFASSAQPESTPAATFSGAVGAMASGASTIDPATHEQLREALFAKNDTTQLAVTLDTKVGERQGETRQLSLSSHLDGKDLPFRKDGETSTNTVTFVFGVFDPKGDLLSAQQRHVDLTVPNGQMSNFMQTGVGEDASFDLKPGTYRVRLVVIDSAEHHMTTFSRSVRMP